MTRFRPAWWLPGAHAQTIGGRLLRSRRRVPARRERIELPDGDFLDLDWSEPAASGPATPLVLVLHGLEGSTESGYVRATFSALAERGVRAVGMNFRGCSGEMNRLPRFYHAGETEDPAHVLGLLRERFPAAPLGAVGFSLGGNVLLKYLGERGGEAARLLRGAAAVSVPFDLAAGAERMERGMGRVYTGHFMRKLLRKASAKTALIGDRCRVDRLPGARTLRQFDEWATAPLHGFRDAGHYYDESSAARWLERIRVPTLLLHAGDDPFLPPEAIPLEGVRANPCLTERFTPAGGHVGFVSGPPWAPVFWAEREAAAFLAQRLGAGS